MGNKLIETNGIQFAFALKTVEIKVMNRKPPLVKMEKDKGGTFHFLPVPDPEPPAQAFDKNRFTASDLPGQGHHGTGLESAADTFSQTKGLALGAGRVDP